MGRNRGRRGQRKGQIYFPHAMDLDDGPLSCHCGLWQFGFPEKKEANRSTCACRPLFVCACVCVYVSSTSLYVWTHAHISMCKGLVIISLRVSNSISHHIEVGLKKLRFSFIYSTLKFDSQKLLNVFFILWAFGKVSTVAQNSTLSPQSKRPKFSWEFAWISFPFPKTFKSAPLKSRYSPWVWMWVWVNPSVWANPSY